jgi:hypothetical protein
MSMAIYNHGLFGMMFLAPLDVIGKGSHLLSLSESLWENHR